MGYFASRRVIGAGAVLALVSTLSACGPKEPPKPAPPPVVVVPPQPYPPLGAPASMVTPPVDSTGLRRTVNTGITQAQTVWNLRSAYNVAALNCQKPEHAAILEGYREFLKAHVKPLTAANKAVDKEFKDKNGTGFIKVREAYMTQVYNYFALPPTLPLFCDAALQVSQSGKGLKAADFNGFATTSLVKLDQVFLEFYTGYDQYRADLAAWQARYAPPAVAPTVSSAPVISLPAAATPAKP